MEIKWHGDYYYSIEIDGVESERINKDLNCGNFAFAQKETNNALKEAQDFAEKIKNTEMWVEEGVISFEVDEIIDDRWYDNTAKVYFKVIGLKE